ncbi:hypothetical protein NL676_009331 [Syzygium grande]|nr:hypothetical protein NL676_009331 [Syzygium grande]
MAPQFPVASRTRARAKREDPFAGCLSKAEPGRRKGGSGAEVSGRGARPRASSVLGGLGAGGVAGDDGHGVIVITDDEDGSDEVILVSGGVEEEDEPCDDGLQTVCRFEPNRNFLKGKNTPSGTKDPDLSSSTETSTEADDSSDESFVAYMSESLTTEEYVSGSERDEILERRKKRKREDKGQSCSFYSARKNNKKLAIDSIDDPMMDDEGRKENMEQGDSWVNEWLLDDVKEEKDEKAINVDRLNAKIDCPSNDDNGNSGQTEEGRSFNVSERGGLRETEETGRRGEGDDERLQEKGKAARVNTKGKMGEMEERRNFRAPGEERLNQSREKSTSQNKVSGVDRRMEEKRYGKHVQSDSDPVIRYATSSKVEGRKERVLGKSCSSQQLHKKRKHEKCSGKKAFANEIGKNDWDEDELLKDDTEKEIAEKEKQCAGDSTVKEERKGSTECGILTKPSEEDVGAHQAEVRKDGRSPHDHHIRWERPRKSKEFKYFERVAKKFRSN